MIKESNIYCGPCESQHSTSVAEFWCPNCDEGLCSKCMEYHKVSKASRMHKTITIENLTTLPDFVRNIDHVCSSHDNTLDLYCSVHEKVCCMDCISAEHSECPGITSLTKVVQGVKESAFYYSVVKSIEDVTEFATKLQTNRKDNVDKLQHEKDLLVGEVKSKRTEIASHLDKLEVHLLQELDSTISLESQQIDQAVSHLQKKICTLKEYKNHISVITDIATDIQAFIALKEIHRNVVHEKETMLYVKEATGMKEISVGIQFVKEIEELVQEMKSMGNVELTKIATNMHFPGPKSHLVKILSDIQPGIENIKLTFLTKFQLPFDIDINICCCVILPDERVVLANNSNEEKGGIHIFDESGEYQKHIVCTSKPFGLAVINKSDIAVSFYKEQSIKVYDSESFKVKYVLLEGHCVFGLSVESDCLAAAVRNTGIHFINYSSGKILKILPSDIDLLTYVHMIGENTLITDYEKDILYCRNRDGKTVWKYSSDVMKGPRNMCTDTVGNIFVAAFVSDSIIAISPDGKNSKKILGVEDGLKNPKAICFSESTSTLLVVSQTGTALKYNLSYS
ncbi:tripartite motif-containing protein 2-like [Mytilus trossulus]|uniref:tripartite motif-containing protein 2-like n=1 Tax=Mytilus trossulus TaxID=6551 RepID=UPI0030062189